MLLIQIYQSAHRYFRASRCIDDIRNYLYTDNTYKHPQYQGCRHSSVDSSAPSILPPWVRVPSTPSMLFFNVYSSNFIFVNWIRMRKEWKCKKRPGLAHFLKWRSIVNVCITISKWDLKHGPDSLRKKCKENLPISGQSYTGSTIINYNFDLKIPHLQL